MSKTIIENNRFYVDVSKGYVIKGIVDTLCAGGLQRGCFVIKSDGILLRQPDQGCTILYNVDLPRKNFKLYICNKPITISINLKHVQGLLKNVKKKESISLYIKNDKKEQGKFFISIRPADTSRESVRKEVNSIAYVEEKGYVPIDLPIGGYKYPMVIGSADFQKIKRLITIGKTINVSIQGNNYLSFKCDPGVVFDSELVFGEKIDSTENKPSEETDDSLEEVTWFDGETSSEDDDANVDTNTVFSSDYYSNILNKLIRLPGLCTQIQFYAPTIPQYPLLLEVSAGQGGSILGSMQIYIKDVNQITYETSLANEASDAVIVTKKGKK